MTRTIATSVTALCLMTSVASADPTMMTDEQMDSQVAGATIETKSGKIVWTLTSASPPMGSNNGGKGNTAKAAGGLTNAVGAGGLKLMGL